MYTDILQEKFKGRENFGENHRWKAKTILD